MRRIVLAFRAFFATLLSAVVAEEVAGILGKDRLPSAGEEKPGRQPKAATPPVPARSEALTLLATLQREARFVDFVQEPLTGYSDAQIGAAARDVHRGCREVLDRLFALRPVLADEQRSTVEVPAAFDPGRYQLTGNVGSTPPMNGRLMHGGWEATRCELPSWSGSDAAARIVAPVELEL